VSFDLPKNPISPTNDLALKRANILARLDLERAERVRRRTDPIEDIDRRMERIEAAIAELYRRVDDARDLAAYAAERAEAAEIAAA
jgi:hypothetical protein